ncbi:uncharacterized protein LOC115509840 [Lynx canadensis]|uniref:uncharacterized protein LOC115509840 n=1 Tax=Lynx canadensis TaxID=61383 RepID=UPI0011B02222|nr:uncharacterized protein LOC115509840 [Lynx canadensis]
MSGGRTFQAEKLSDAKVLRREDIRCYEKEHEDSSSAGDWRGPAAAFKGPPRGPRCRPRSGGGVWDAPAHCLAEEYGVPRKGAGKRKEGCLGWAALGGVDSLCKSQRSRPRRRSEPKCELRLLHNCWGPLSPPARQSVSVAAAVARLSGSGSLRARSPPPLTRAFGSLRELPSARIGRSRPSASPRRHSPPAALTAPADMSGDHLHNDSQIEADFRLNDSHNTKIT